MKIRKQKWKIRNRCFLSFLLSYASPSRIRVFPGCSPQAGQEVPDSDVICLYKSFQKEIVAATSWVVQWLPFLPPLSIYLCPCYSFPLFEIFSFNTIFHKLWKRFSLLCFKKDLRVQNGSQIHRMWEDLCENSGLTTQTCNIKYILELLMPSNHEQDLNVTFANPAEIVL